VIDHHEGDDRRGSIRHDEELHAVGAKPVFRDAGEGVESLDVGGQDRTAGAGRVPGLRGGGGRTSEAERGQDRAGEEKRPCGPEAGW
jgi:hypothetical protein